MSDTGDHIFMFVKARKSFNFFADALLGILQTLTARKTHSGRAGLDRLPKFQALELSKGFFF